MNVYCISVYLCKRDRVKDTYTPGMTHAYALGGICSESFVQFILSWCNLVFHVCTTSVRRVKGKYIYKSQAPCGHLPFCRHDYKYMLKSPEKPLNTCKKGMWSIHTVCTIITFVVKVAVRDIREKKRRENEEKWTSSDI